MSTKDMNISLLDATYKDNSPINTVEKIKGILATHGISATEHWSESGVEHCYSLRLSVDGTAFGVNGKGLTREFALASAYGELAERMQLGLFGDSSVQKLGHYDAAIGTDERLTATELYNELPHWYDSLATRLNEIDGTGADGMELISRFADRDGKLISTSFYNLMSGKRVHIPREIRCLSCGSNGGAAGNSMEEAVVQAISEIVERHHKLTVIKQGVSLPDIPEDLLKQFKVAYKIITDLRSRGLSVFVKDCSMGTKFPVVCVYYVNRETGKYHTHFGAYPILEIAIERTLTESFQGRSIDRFTNNEDFIYNLDNVNSYQSVYKELKRGNYDKSPEFFVGESRYSYNSNAGFNGGSNKELLSQLVEYFGECGKEILVRDGSSLGFPTYNVLIPGYSEIIVHGLSKKQSGFVNAKSAAMALRNPSAAGLDEYMLLLLHISEMKKLSSLNERLFTFATCANLPFDAEKWQDQLLMSSTLAYVYYGMGNLSQALNFVGKMIPCVDKADSEYLLCLKRYMAMVLNGDDDAKIKSLLGMFHKADTVKGIYLHVQNGTNPLDKFVLHCDENSCEGCIAGSICKQRYTRSLIEIVHNGAKQLDFDSFVGEISKYRKH